MNFEQQALALYTYQMEHNSVYRKFVHLSRGKTFEPARLDEIPCLPISFFKTHRVATGDYETYFESSGTTGMERSRHYIADKKAYLRNAVDLFSYHYGKDPTEYAWLALLPGYLDNPHSSLISMVKHFIDRSQYGSSGFFLHDMDDLYDQLNMNIKKELPTILLGVSFALLDFSENYKLPRNKLIVMETGGMKGRRKELTRKELHDMLTASLGVDHIHSEYGMTELQSQSYARDDGWFRSNHRLQVIVRPVDDPWGEQEIGKTGRLDLIDLANRESCPFIASSDLGMKRDKMSFKVLGRMDNSDIRGCNLLYQ